MPTLARPAEDPEQSADAPAEASTPAAVETENGAAKKGKTIIRLKVRKSTDTPAPTSTPQPSQPPQPVRQAAAPPKTAVKAEPKATTAACTTKKAAPRQKPGRMITASERALCEHVVKGMGLFGLKSET